MFIILAFFTGVISFLNMILASKVAGKTGMIKGIFYNFLWATVFSFLGFIVFEPKEELFKNLETIPIFYYIAGFIGIVVNFIFNKAIPKVSSVYIVILRFIGQLLLGCIIDYFYLNIYSLGKLLGLIFFGLGLIYNSYVDNKYKLAKNEGLAKSLKKIPNA